MITWTRNIFIAVVVALVIVGITRVSILGEFDGGISIDPVYLVTLLLLGCTCTVVIWALGLTRLSGARSAERFAVVLCYLEQSVRMNLPLPRMLKAAQASEPRWIGSRLAALRKRIEIGDSIADSIRIALPGTSRRTLALLRTAEQVGRVGPELTRLLRHEQNRPVGEIARRSFLRSYPVAMIIGLVFITSLLMTFVMPKYEQIFHDFRIPLPALTQLLIQLCDYPLQWLLLATVGIILLLSFQKLRHRLQWFGPFGWFTTNRDLADICHLLCEELNAGQPLQMALRAASELSISSNLRHKLRRWADGIEAGQPSVDSAHAAGLPELLARLTTSAEGFEFLSRYYAGKFSRMLILLRAAIVPLMTLFFAVCVAFVALSVFLPMISMINSLSGSPFTSGL